MSFTHSFRPQTLVWAAVALALVVLLWLLAPILTPFVVAAVLAYLGDPAVNALTRRKLPRLAAALIVLAALGLVLSALVLILLPVLWREGLTLAQRLPELAGGFNARWSPWLAAHFGIDFRLDAAQFQEWLGQARGNAQDLAPVVLGHLGKSGLAIVAALVNLLLIPVVAFYLLLEWPRVVAGVERAWPRPWLARTTRIARDIDSVLAQFCRGQLSVMLLLAIYYCIGLWLAGIQFWLPVGVFTGLLIFIPYAGFFGGLMLAVLTALLQGGGWGPLVGVAVVYGVGQLVESFLLTPYLVGERIGLHPLAVIFALMAFGQLFGFVGVLVALPASAALLVGIREVAREWFASAVYRGDGGGEAA